MYREEIAEVKDVDLILDFKLDIIFSSSEAASMERADMEKTVNYCEEEIRENIDKYRILYEDETIVAAYFVDDYSDGKIIDLIYVMPDKRRLGIGDYILSNIINNNYQPLYAWIYNENEIANHLFKSKNFIIEEENKYKSLLKNGNEKEENKCIKIKMFEREVEELSKKYGVEYKLECKNK